MCPEPTAETRSVKELELYDLHAEKPNWTNAFDAKLVLYGTRGLQDFLAHLDDILSRPGIGPATQEKYQSKRDEVQLELDAREEARQDAAREKRELTYPTDFDQE